MTIDDQLPERLIAVGGAVGTLVFLMARVFRYERDFIGDQRDEIERQRVELDELRKLPAAVARLAADVAEAKAETAQCHRERIIDRARIVELEHQIADLRKSSP